MKKILLILFVLIASVVRSQTFNPSLFTVSNKPYGLNAASPVDARSYFFDVNFQTFRPYQSVNEVYSYLNLAKYRTGQFDIIVNQGGVLSGGLITGGVNYIYFFRNGTTNGDLVLKGNISTVNGQSGAVVVGNADSLKTYPIDTSSNTDGFVLTFDKINKKFILTAKGSAPTYSAGVGIDITGNVIRALNESPLWNANAFRGRSISTTAPSVNQVLKWDGIQYSPASVAGIDTMYFNGDYFYIISSGDTTRTLITGADLNVNSVRTEAQSGYNGNIPLVDLQPLSWISLTNLQEAFATWSVNATVNVDGTTVIGDNTIGSPIRVDTSSGRIATQSMLQSDSIGRIPGVDSFQVYKNGIHVYSVKDSSGAAGSGLTAVSHDGTLLGDGTGGDVLKVDTSAGKIATKSDVAAISATYPNITAGPGIAVGGTLANPIISNTAFDSTAANPENALVITSFGGVSDAVAAGAGATGTNNTPALNAMLAAAQSGQLCIIPPGRWLFSTVPDTIKGPKTVYLKIYGTTYHNGNDFLIFSNPPGPYELHNVEHYGSALSRLNLPAQTKANYDNGTGPNWASLTGTLYKVVNTSQIKMYATSIQGFQNAVEIIGGDANGSQENYFFGRSIRQNANGIVLTSLTGNSYCDKNTFYFERISGGLGIKIDGYGSPAPVNGEIWNGAFRSNKFIGLIELVDSICDAHGDITEPEFNVTIEAGVNTGVLGQNGYRMRSISPNFVRGPKYNGQGILNYNWINQTGNDGVGINGTINMPVWNGGVYYGNYALINSSGNIVFQQSYSLSKTNRDNAPVNFLFRNFGDAELEVTITAASYSVATNVKYVYYNNTAGNLTLPAVASSVGREVVVFNQNVNNLTVTGATTGTPQSGNSVTTYRCNGVNWYAVSQYGVIGGGGGGGNWTVNGANQYTNGSIGVGINPSTYYARYMSGASTTSLALMEFPTSSVYNTVLRDGAWDFNGSKYRIGIAGVPETIATDYNAMTFVNKTWQGFPIGIGYWATTGGLRNQIARVNAAGTAMEFAYSFGTTTTITGSSYTVLPGDQWVVCNASSGTVTVTMPTASSFPGRRITVRNKNAGSTVTISGGDPNTTNALASGQAAITYWSDGTNWLIESKF